MSTSALSANHTNFEYNYDYDLPLKPSLLNAHIAKSQQQINDYDVLSSPINHSPEFEFNTPQINPANYMPPKALKSNPYLYDVQAFLLSSQNITHPYNTSGASLQIHLSLDAPNSLTDEVDDMFGQLGGTQGQMWDEIAHYNQSTFTTKNDLLNRLRHEGVQEAWVQEFELALAKLPTTVELSPSQLAELLTIGRVKGIIGHHGKTVSGAPEFAAKADNIHWIKSFREHLKRHGGNFKKNPDEPFTNRTPFRPK